ncbi:hypothetical protein F2P81_023266 [Scophthalmus maximus]|uniref:Uncharacterized protein n=1 Tax=Scophthalmus maximus TaxID=52904 RepID=A0A6A4S1T5_SCOMX|nr:hypothetical protein F2P81_023266 [Scophthalmus maximus]
MERDDKVLTKLRRYQRRAKVKVKCVAVKQLQHVYDADLKFKHSGELIIITRTNISPVLQALPLVFYLSREHF